MTTVIDPFERVKHLQKSGLEEPVAKALVSAQLDFNAGLGDVKADIRDLNIKFDHLDQKVDQKIDHLDQKVDQKIDHLDQKVDQMDQKIDRLEDKIGRLGDTVHESHKGLQKMIVGLFVTILVGLGAMILAPNLATSADGSIDPAHKLIGHIPKIVFIDTFALG